MFKGKSDISSKEPRLGSHANSHRSMNLDINVVIVDNQFHLTAKKRKQAPSDAQSTKQL